MKETVLALDTCERYKEAGKGMLRWELSGLHFCNQRKSGEGRKPPSSSFLSRH